MIVVEDKFLVIGGYGAIKTEVCDFADDQMDCVEQNSTVEDYIYYPELALVSDDYDSDC